MNTSNTNASAEGIIEQPAQDVLAFFTSLFGNELVATALTIAVVLLATAIITHLATRFLRHLLSRENSPLPSSSIFINIARVILWAIGVSIILSTCFGVDVTAAIAALGIGGIALSLGFQDTLSNLIGGLQISILGIVEPGDHIEMSGSRGVVRDVSWRHVTIETATGSCVVVPNSIINKNSFVKLPPAEKVVVSICVSKGVTDLHDAAERMEAAVKAALKDVTQVEKGPTILFDSTTEFGYNGSVIVWIDSCEDVLFVKDAVVRALAPFYNAEGVVDDPALGKDL